MRSVRLIPLAAVGFAVATVGAEAETWPTKPIRAIVPIAAGSVIRHRSSRRIRAALDAARSEHRRGESCLAQG